MPRKDERYVNKLIRFPTDLAEEVQAIADAGDRPYTAQVLRIVRQWVALYKQQGNREPVQDARETLEQLAAQSKEER